MTDRALGAAVAILTVSILGRNAIGLVLSGSLILLWVGLKITPQRIGA